jgi:endoglucanase
MMSSVRYLAPFLVSFAVACGASSAGSGETEPTTGDTGTAETKSGNSGASTTSSTQAAPLPTSATNPDRAAPTAPAEPSEVPTASESEQAAPDAPVATQPPPAAVAQPVVADTGTRFHGVNLSGADFTSSALPGVEGRDYGWPTHAEVDYFTAKGVNTFRVGFLWERMQPKAYGTLDATYAAKLDDLVAYATSHGANVILNPQNFARYYGNPVGSSAVPNAAFADFWKRMSARYSSNARVMFNLVNEPHDLPTEQWVGAANAAIAAIRGTGATNLIHVPGNAYTGAHSWNESWYGTPNAKAMLNIKDPGNHFVYEVHQYLDSSSGGKTGDCVSTTIGSERMKGFVDWLRANGKKGFVGELAGGNNATCNAAVTDMLDSIEDASDVLEGWLWWGGGPRWSPGYPFAIDPKDGQDAPQLALLTPYLD